jgi:coenzyme PQQ precursor peptide PqqA
MVSVARHPEEACSARGAAAALGSRGVKWGPQKGQKGLAMRAAVAYIGGTGSPATAEEATMQWRTPKMVEIACGCEINAYFPADL